MTQPGWHDDLQLATARMFYAAMGGDPNDPRRAQKVSKIQIALRDALAAPPVDTLRALPYLIHLARQRWDGEWTYTLEELAERWTAGQFHNDAAESDAKAALAFPDHPVIPTTPLVFDDTALRETRILGPSWVWAKARTWGAWLLSKLKDKPYESR